MRDGRTSRAVLFASVIAGCGWGALLAIYAALAVYLASRGAVPERVWESIAISAFGLLCSTALPVVLSRNRRDGAALALVGFGLLLLLPAGAITYLWRPWTAPYCWICGPSPYYGALPAPAGIFPEGALLQARS